jgi:hypothetical protein
MTMTGSPRVVAIAGRRVDAPDASSPRFPLAQAPAVREAIRAFLAREAATHIVTSAACGADLLALQVARELGLGRRVVLPFQADRFRASSVIDRPGDWGPLFDAMLADARASSDLVVMREEGGDDDALYAEANGVILDVALRLGREAGGETLALVVWDERPRSDGIDLTSHFLEQARRREIQARSISTLSPSPAPPA